MLAEFQSRVRRRLGREQQRSPSIRLPLRCQFLITSMPVGGAETLLVNLLRRLDPNVLQPEVVCLKEPGPLGEQLRDEFPVHSQLIGNKYDATVLYRLARLMNHSQTDVVITVGAGDKMFWGRLAARLARVPVVISALHSTGWPDGVGRLNRLLTPLTSAFIAVADSHAEYLVQHERFPANKVHVVRNGVDCNRFTPDVAAKKQVCAELGLPTSVQFAGILAALRPEKNHALLVAAAAKLRKVHPDLHWLIVGDGPQREMIESQCRKLNVEDRVHLLGVRHDTPRLLSALDVFTLCSLNEASPVSILEALACEVPVVASDVGSVGETVLEGQTGLLFANEDLEGMTAGLNQLLGDGRLRERMGRQGRQVVLRTGSLESMVKGYQRLATSLYDSVTGASSSVGVAV